MDEELELIWAYISGDGDEETVVKELTKLNREKLKKLLEKHKEIYGVEIDRIKVYKITDYRRIWPDWVILQKLTEREIKEIKRRIAEYKKASFEESIDRYTKLENYIKQYKNEAFFWP